MKLLISVLVLFTILIGLFIIAFSESAKIEEEDCDFLKTRLKDVEWTGYWNKGCLYHGEHIEPRELKVKLLLIEELGG